MSIVFENDRIELRAGTDVCQNEMYGALRKMWIALQKQKSGLVEVVEIQMVRYVNDVGLWQVIL